MRPSENIEKRIQNIPINTSVKKDQEVLEDALKALEKSKTEQSAIQPNIWRIIMQSKITKTAAAAAIFIAILIGINFFGARIDGTSALFAAAMDSIKQARTFSCTQIYEMNYVDNEKEGKYIFKEKIMFKEPYRERRVKLTSPWPEFVGEITITNFSKRQELTIRPAKKTATLYDLSYNYYVEEGTGELKLTELDTSLRDQLLEWAASAVEDLGYAELDGQQVRTLQSGKKGRITTVWIDLKNNFPVQIEHKWTDQKRSPVMYTSIQIDTELDDELFSLKPPEGYDFSISTGNWPVGKSKLGAKIMHLGKLCFYYASKNENKFPDKFSDLVTSDITTNEVLKKVLAAPEEPNGPPVFQYRKPNTGSKNPSTEVILYEIYHQWPDDGIVVCFADGHAEIIREQNRFEQLIK